MNQDIRNLDFKAQTPAEWRDWTWLTPEEFEHLRDYIYDYNNAADFNTGSPCGCTACFTRGIIARAYAYRTDSGITMMYSESEHTDLLDFA